MRRILVGLLAVVALLGSGCGDSKETKYAKALNKWLDQTLTAVSSTSTSPSRLALHSGAVALRGAAVRLRSVKYPKGFGPLHGQLVRETATAAAVVDEAASGNSAIASNLPARLNLVERQMGNTLHQIHDKVRRANQ